MCKMMGDMPWSDNLRQMSEIYSYGNKFYTIIGNKFPKPTKSVIKFSQDLQINLVADLVTYLMTNTSLSLICKRSERVTILVTYSSQIGRGLNRMNLLYSWQC